MLHLVGNMISSVLTGLLMSMALAVALWFLPKMISVRYEWKITGLLGVVVLFFFFWFQSALLFGALKLKKYVPTVQQIEQTVRNIPNIDFAQTGTAEEFTLIMRTLSNQYPDMASFIQKTAGKESGTSSENLSVFVLSYSNRIHKTIGAYCMRRCGWILLGMLLGGGLLVRGALQGGRQITRRRRIVYEE